MKKIAKIIITLFFCAMQVVGQTDDRLQRTVTEKIPEGMKPYYPQRHFSLLTGRAADAVIVRADDKAKEAWAALIREAIQTRWAIDIPVVSWEEAQEKHEGKSLILFGDVNENMPLRRLHANFQLGDNERGYELRSCSMR